MRPLVADAASVGVGKELRTDASSVHNGKPLVSGIAQLGPQGADLVETGFCLLGLF